MQDKLWLSDEQAHGFIFNVSTTSAYLIIKLIIIFLIFKVSSNRFALDVHETTNNTLKQSFLIPRSARKEILCQLSLLWPELTETLFAL